MAGIGSLPLFHRLAGQRVVVIGTGEMADARRRLVKRAGGLPCAETEAHHAKLAFIALEDERAARAAANRLRGKGLLVNVTDRPALCDFTVPSILDRDPVLIAVGTSGASAGLAKHLRLRLEALLPSSLGALAQGLFAAREKLRARLPEAAQRRRALDAALTAKGPLDPLALHDDDAVERWIDGVAGADDSDSEAGRASQIVTIALTSDDPDALTLRQARWLGEADYLVLDDTILAPFPDAILVRARADAVRIAPSDLASKSPEGLTVLLTRAG